MEDKEQVDSSSLQNLRSILSLRLQSQDKRRGRGSKLVSQPSCGEVLQGARAFNRFMGQRGASREESTPTGRRRRGRERLGRVAGGTGRARTATFDPDARIISFSCREPAEYRAMAATRTSRRAWGPAVPPSRTPESSGTEAPGPGRQKGRRAPPRPLPDR